MFVPPPRSVMVCLESWEHDWAVHVADQRTSARYDSPDAAHYDPVRMEDNVQANRAATATEMAVAKYLKHYWSGSYWPVKQHNNFVFLPDVEPNIEVRRVREPNNPLVVRRTDVQRQRLMVTGWPDPSTDFTQVYLIGYIDAKEGWLRGEPAPYDYSNTRLVPQAFLDSWAPLRRTGT